MQCIIYSAKSYLTKQVAAREIFGPFYFSTDVQLCHVSSKNLHRLQKAEKGAHRALLPGGSWTTAQRCSGR